VCYINRSKTTRRLDDESEKQLEQALSRISGVRFKSLFMEDYSFQEQFRIVYGCHVLIGVHGIILDWANSWVMVATQRNCH
jgi:hypothetical protein